MTIKTDVVAERAVLAGICKYGPDLFLDITDLVKTNTFSIDVNKVIFKCLKHICKDHQAEIDLPSILSASQELELNHVLERKEEAKHLNSIINLHTERTNVRRFAMKLRKLEIARLLYDQGEVLKQKMSEMDGTEAISQILGTAENIIFDFTSLIDSDDEFRAKHVGESIDEYVDYLENNPCQSIGIGTGFPLLDESIGGGLNPGAAVMGARAKVGKMQPYSSHIYTPNGIITMGDIKIGDVVCTPDGNTGIVQEVIENGIQDVYEITFDDDSKCRCGLEHLFKVKHTRKKEYEILSLKDILSFGNGSLHEQSRPKWQIPLVDNVSFVKQDVKLDPYIMGILLGDGSFRNTVSLTNVDYEIVNALKDDLPNGYYLRKSDITYFPTHGTNKPNHYKNIIREYKLYNLKSCDKFIPKEYLFNDIDTRLSILQGLLDTDGGLSNKKGKIIEYSSASEQLAKDVKFLAESLGCKTKLIERFVDGFKSHRLLIKSNDPSRFFRLHRKKSACCKRTKPSLKRKIVDVKKVSSENCRCIYIDHPDHLYITNDFIVTHNTTTSMAIAYNIASRGIPVLYLDTEMIEKGRYRDISDKLLASVGDCDIKDVKTGAFASDPLKRQRIREAADKIKSSKLFRIDIAGKAFEDQLYAMRKWVQTEVGINPDGTAKECVIIYDYLKLMNMDGLNDSVKEFQALGVMMTALQNFGIRYAVPLLVFTQLNRDGIDKESSAVVSGSDRITWFCTSFTILKYKSDEEIALDGIQLGNRKFVTILSRYGPGHDSGEYVNAYMNKYRAQIREINPKDIEENQGFAIEDNENDIPF